MCSVSTYFDLLPIYKNQIGGGGDGAGRGFPVYAEGCVQYTIRTSSQFIIILPVYSAADRPCLVARIPIYITEDSINILSCCENFVSFRTFDCEGICNVKLAEINSICFPVICLCLTRSLRHTYRLTFSRLGNVISVPLSACLRPL